MAEQTAHDFTFTDIDGKPMPLAAYKGKVLLVVNTATRCSFSIQYGPLRELQNMFQNEGFTIIGAPSDQFHQEPLAEADIKLMCQQKFLVNFPLTAKTIIAGKDAHPFFAWARKQGGWLAAPKWNFHKYLIGPDGRLVNWYFSSTSPTSRRVLRDIERLLQNKA